MNHRLENRFPIVLSVNADAATAPATAPDGRAELSVVAPVGLYGRTAPEPAPAGVEGTRYRVASGGRLRWTRPRRGADHRPMVQRAGLRMERHDIPMPCIPEGIPDEAGTSLGALAAVLVAYHRIVPASLKDEYVRQVMKLAGEKAGQLIRSTWDQP